MKERYEVYRINKHGSLELLRYKTKCAPDGMPIYVYASFASEQEAIQWMSKTHLVSLKLFILKCYTR